MINTHEYFVAGQAALKSAAWGKAKTCFEELLTLEDDAEGHDGLGLALWWLNDIPNSHHHRMLAYVGFKQRGDVRRAALIAAWLAREQFFLDGNSSAMNGWFARADRLLGDENACPERAWVTMQRAALVADAEDLERVALQTIATARQYEDINLEIFALAWGGMAQVNLGRVDAGMTCLDEAMVAATGGEVTSFTVASEVFCVMLSACELAGDLVRTQHWCDTASRFAQRYNCSFLSSSCRTTYGGLLMATGRWGDAESELMQAIRTLDSGHRALRMFAIMKLADLRIYQGRFEEAEVLLTGYEDRLRVAAMPLARLHLARGEAHLAQAVLEQALGFSQLSTLQRVPLLSLLVEVRLAMGEVETANREVEELLALSQETRSDFLMAQAELVCGYVKHRAGEDSAADLFQSALDRLRLYEHSLLAARARLEMARILRDKNLASAMIWGRAALATFERLGTPFYVNEAARLLRDLGVTGRVGSRQHNLLTQRESEVLALMARGLTNREIADQLVISAKTVEHHVSQILGKLGLRSRAAAAAFATRKSTNAISE